MVGRLYDDVVCRVLEVIGVALVDDELLTAAKAGAVALAAHAALVDAAGHLVGAQAGGVGLSVSASAGRGLALAGRGDLPRGPERLAEERAKDGDVDGNDTDNSLTHAPAVDVGTTGVGTEGEYDSDDGCCNDEETGADQETNNNLPIFHEVY